MDRWDWILVVGSVLIGQVALLLIETLRTWLERVQRRQDRRDDFQHDTLIELREALIVMADTAGVVYTSILDCVDPAYPALAEYRKAEARFHSLFYSVIDDETRAACDQYLVSMRKVFDATQGGISWSEQWLTLSGA